MLSLQPVTNVFYFVDDLAAAREWYGELLGAQPIEVQPQLVTFAVGSSRLTLHAADEFNVGGDMRGTVAYWGVDDVDVAVARCVALGAVAHRGPKTIFTGERLCQLTDPFGNLFGVRQAPPHEPVHKEQTVSERPFFDEPAAAEAAQARTPAQGLGGTVVLVTGASSGIGAAAAATLAAHGAAVALAARRTDRLEALAASIRAQGGTALVIESDITDEQQARAAVERTVAELGRLDTLVNNAGVMLLGPVVDAPLSEWQRMVELNVLALLYCAHAALPHLLRAAEDSPRRVADMVNISSVAGRVAGRGRGVYNLTKHGIGAFSESLRQEVTGRHVRISLVEPGATATELVSHNRDEVVESLRSQISGMQPMQAEDIADAVAYIVTRPRHVAVNELLIRPTEQE